MAVICGFDFPEELYYLVEKHVWVKPIGNGLTRIGLTPVAYQLLHNTLGQEVPQGKSVAMVESLKYIGPVAAPFAGVVVRANERLLNDPDAAVTDPYSDGWIAELRSVDWESAAAGLLTGEAAMTAYRALLKSQNLTAEASGR